MKVLVLLLLSLQDYAEGNCGQDLKLKIMKNDSAYQLQLCTSTDSCTTPTNLISLCDEQRLCDYCEGIPDRSGLGCDERSACVTHIDSFFSDYCEIFEFTQPTTETACTNKLAPVASLAALTGLLLVILVLVVTGWVWTCWTMKKKIKETQLYKNCQEGESEEERFRLNQIDKMTTTTQAVVGTAIDQLLHSLEESGQSNNRFSSKDNKGHRDVKRVENFYTSSEGSTNSSLQQEQAVNRVEEGESGEKHVYHVLEKPGDDDYEDPDKDLEDNTATEYETPISLKELGLKHASIHTN